MPKAKKLPSGSWRCRVYSHTGPDGVKHYESFTAPTKQEAEMQAAKFATKKERISKSDLTVAEAIEGYINAKSGVLSPCTVRGYRVIQRNGFNEINNIRIKKLDSETVQKYISNLASVKSEKTVRNTYALLTSALSLYLPDAHFRVTLPPKRRKSTNAPSDEDVKRLFREAAPWLKTCIALAAYGSMRRGEICALKYGDVKGRIVHIHADIIPNENGQYVYKDMPKNDQSVRDVLLPQKVIDLMGKGKAGDFIISKSPNTITTSFIRLRDKMGLAFRFHDLRHYYASIGAVLQVPDSYLSEFGGWKKGSGVMKEVYQNGIKSMSEVYAEKMAEHFGGMMDDTESEV